MSWKYIKKIVNLFEHLGNYFNNIVFPNLFLFLMISALAFASRSTNDSKTASKKTLQIWCSNVFHSSGSREHSYTVRIFKAPLPFFSSKDTLKFWEGKRGEPSYIFEPCDISCIAHIHTPSTNKQAIIYYIYWYILCCLVLHI